MIYSFSISTPANTPESAKIDTQLKIAYGIIHSVEIQFPPGPCGLLHIHINDALHQLFPYNASEDFASDNETISFREFIPALIEPYILTAHTWNLDDTYAHLIIIRIGILTPEIIAPWLMTYQERIQAAMGV
jgi:hypothetical protein